MQTFGKDKLLSVAAFVLVGIAGSLSPALKAEPLSVTLTGAQEVPPVKTLATATSSIAVAPDRSVSGSIDTTGIEGTMAHIHMGALGVNGPVIVKLEKSSDTRWSVPAGTKLTQMQYESYRAGDLYVNVHSAAHPGGEIRLQLTPTTGVKH